MIEIFQEAPKTFLGRDLKKIEQHPKNSTKIFNCQIKPKYFDCPIQGLENWVTKTFLSPKLV
jgi:hypothetical protein